MNNLKTFSLFITHLINNALKSSHNYDYMIAEELEEIKKYKMIKFIPTQQGHLLVCEFIDGKTYTIEVNPVKEIAVKQLSADDIIINGGF